MGGVLQNVSELFCQSRLVSAGESSLCLSSCWTSYGLKSFMVEAFIPQIISRYCKSRCFFLLVFCLFWRASLGNHVLVHHYLRTSRSRLCQLCSSSVPGFMRTTIMTLLYSPWSPQGRPTGICLSVSFHISYREHNRTSDLHAHLRETQ